MTETVIDELTELGLADGSGDGSFKPDKIHYPCESGGIGEKCGEVREG